MSRPEDKLDPERREFLDEALEQIFSLPLEHQKDAILQLFDCALKVMKREQIAALRAELAVQVGEESEVIEVIDGHLALLDLPLPH